MDIRTAIAFDEAWERIEAASDRARSTILAAEHRGALTADEANICRRAIEGDRDAVAEFWRMQDNGNGPQGEPIWIN